MPFKKNKKGTYTSPSGREYSKKQVALYHANNGFPKKKKKK